MALIIDSQTFLVNINWRDEFQRPIDLDTVAVHPESVRGKPWIIFLNLKSDDFWSRSVSAELFDSWTFMDPAIIDEAYSRILKLKLNHIGNY